MPDSTSFDDKSILRNRFSGLRRSLAPEERQRLAEAAAARLLATPAWQRAQTVALYMAIRAEINAAPLLDAALKQNKHVLLPLCSPSQPGLMDFVPYAGAASLKPGPFGILEPARPASLPPGAPPLVPDLALTPGLAFDRQGYRLGAGGGYYDRLFAQPAFASCLRIGYAYTFQVVGTLPHDPWDIPMHALCTDQECLWIAPPPS